MTCDGRCCRRIVVPVHPDLLESVGDGDTFVFHGEQFPNHRLLRDMKPYAVYEGPENRDDWGNYFTDGFLRHRYTCKAFDPATGECTVYASRPLSCRMFPETGICPYKGCEHLQEPDPEALAEYASLPFQFVVLSWLSKRPCIYRYKGGYILLLRPTEERMVELERDEEMDGTDLPSYFSGPHAFVVEINATAAKRPEAVMLKLRDFVRQSLGPGGRISHNRNGNVTRHISRGRS